MAGNAAGHVLAGQEGYSPIDARRDNRKFHREPTSHHEVTKVTKKHEEDRK